MCSLTFDILGFTLIECLSIAKILNHLGIEERLKY